MMKNQLRVKLLAGVIASALSVAAPVYAQDTTSGLTGRVVDAKGAPVAGAKVKIVHVPSGTTSNATADANGRYQAQGLRVGGPYHIEAQGTGIKEIDAENVFLNLGETSTINLTETAAATAQLEGVTVTANAAQVAVFNSDNKGLSTNISHAQLEAAVNADRSFQNIARLDPRVSITDRDSGNVSANGKNYRYNCIMVDNVNAGDPFGLNGNGLATITGAPITMDAIDSVQISTSNFDVSQRGCVGANINMVSKSGTNEYHGEVYYGYRTSKDGFMGEIAPVGGNTDSPYYGWKREWTAGFNVGGPIIKDKLFFFLSYEESKRIGYAASSGPSDSITAGTTPVQGINTAFYNSVLGKAQQLGLNPGDQTLANLTNKRYLAKVDWNINDQHRAVFRYSETKEFQPVATGSATQVSPNSNWYFNNRNIKSYLGQLFSDWTDVFSTEANLQYTHVVTARGPLVGGYQPSVSVSNSTSSSTPNVTLGTEFSSHVNALDIKQISGYFAGTWHLGEHTVKAGFNGAQDKVFNAFMQGYYGSYTYWAPSNNSVDNFANGAWEAYSIKQPAPGFDLNSAQANFKKQQYGAFIQDTWQATDRLSLTYGIRMDAPRFPGSPLYNPCFAAAPGAAFTAKNADGSTLCTASKGGFGYTNNTLPSTSPLFQPRVSFNYDFDTEYKTQLRGGVGVFVSDVPTVWYSNSFGNSGLTSVTYSITDQASNPVGTLLCSQNGTSFTKAAGATCPAGQISYVKQAPSYNAGNPLIPGGTTPAAPGASGAQMAVDTIDPNFKMPRTTQIALAFDRELPWMGIISSLELNYTKTNDDILYQMLNYGAPTGVGPDGRNLYYKTISGTFATTRANANPAFGTVTRLTNSHGGQSTSLTWSFTKPMSDDWSAMMAFRVGHSTDANAGASSVANSNIQANMWVNPNLDSITTSNYDVPKRVIAGATWQHKFFGDYKTTVSMFADLHSGAPYSWIAGNDVNGDGYSRDLIYIPKSATDVAWKPGTTATQIQQFMSYIQNNSYLSDHMGQIAGRNATRSPWVNQIDLSFKQEIPGIFEGNKGELRFDFFNFGNLLNSKWGVEKRATFPLFRQLANVTGIDPASGKYIYDITGSQYKDANGNYRPQQLIVNETGGGGTSIPSQRWSVMMTARYTF
ncbi:MAG: TonB-dependent receptor [Rudaea sp.]|uniref:TonB-dependent receptor n=1 Tax=unclassified Rudaea TaxID=2627037 RepID=UPI0010F6A27A|nr:MULTISPECIES: carboxypeptidase regulatory-like domain-containing protein [unclassified Rudaea]MBN8884566.1 TonB-dependent receptor [Rudaea sp.]MBR0344166.1 TonB-dependent receptor [Rudaea sp.]